MKQENKRIGRKGEDLALEYLERKKFNLLKRNFSNRFGEIDLIMEDGGTVVFIEVKTKVGEIYGSPEEMVNRGKLGRVRRMAEVFLAENGWWSKLCRIDVVAVVLDQREKVLRLTHYPNLC